jgi:sugar phosphate isomerase/epimerase
MGARRASCRDNKEDKMDYSYQLYSARNEKSLDDTLKTLKSLGYAQVEGWGGQFADPAALARSVRAAGLAMPTAHMGLDMLLDTQAALKAADAVGIETLFCPAPPSPAYRTGLGDWSKLGSDLAKAAAALKSGGKGLGYHNHHWEFGKLADGRRPIEVLLDSSPDIQWEMDLAWVVKAGEDPIEWMKKLGSRITAIHVKDIAPAGQNADEDGWADVGQGTLDWKSLLVEAKKHTKARYFVMEHDKPSDAIRFARRSMETVKGYGV